MNPKVYLIAVLVVFISLGAVVMFRNQIFLPKSETSLSDSSFGWKFPIDKFAPSGQVTTSGAWSKLRAQGGAPRGLPVRLKIPTIGVDTAIEDAYITPDGRMDVPAGSENVAWFALGPMPGQKGSAVIGGHYGIDNGVPKVFYLLNKLTIGDKVYVVNDKKETLAFVVRSIRLFDRNAESSSVFLSSDGLAHLNVITCEGVWNKVNDSYPDRRVVFTDSIPYGGEVTTNSKVPVDINPSLPQTADTFTSQSLNPNEDATAGSNTSLNVFQQMISGIVTIYQMIVR